MKRLGKPMPGARKLAGSTLKQPLGFNCVPTIYAGDCRRDRVLYPKVAL